MTSSHSLFLGSFLKSCIVPLWQLSFFFSCWCYSIWWRRVGKIVFAYRCQKLHFPNICLLQKFRHQAGLLTSRCKYSLSFAEVGATWTQASSRWPTSDSNAWCPSHQQLGLWQHDQYFQLSRLHNILPQSLGGTVPEGREVAVSNTPLHLKLRTSILHIGWRYNDVSWNKSGVWEATCSWMPPSHQNPIPLPLDLMHKTLHWHKWIPLWEAWPAKCWARRYCATVMPFALHSCSVVSGRERQDHWSNRARVLTFCKAACQPGWQA